jgi:hypothetical protein
MELFKPVNLVVKPNYWRFENDDNVEFIAQGSTARYELFWEIIPQDPYWPIKFTVGFN